jgi:HEPN domain-containing protein
VSTDEQAEAYLREAELTLSSAHAIYNSASEQQEAMWAQVVKNGYDAIEQAVSAAIAARDESIPRRHPSEVNTFIDLYEPGDVLEDLLLHWLRRRSDSQYVDIRGGEVNVPHQQFGEDDAQRILEDAEKVISYVRREIE